MKFILSIASFSWVMFLYLIHNEIHIMHIEYLNNYIYFTNVVFYIFICFMLGYLSLTYVNKSVSNSTKDNLKVLKIYPIYTDYMPIYLAICVIAFELNKINNDNFYATLIIAFFIFIVFYISNVFYLNPAWYVFGKRIFKVENEKGNYIVIVSKNDNYKALSEIENIKKIDEYVFYKQKER